MSDATGAGVATSKYSVDGASASLASEFGFTGQLWLPSVQLYYYKARMYSPQLGRFMQRDPLGYAAGLNLYAYAGGDPVNARDPSGLANEPVLATLDVNGEKCDWFCRWLSAFAGYREWQSTQPGDTSPNPERVGQGSSGGQETHRYEIKVKTTCAASKAYSMIKQTGVSAPGAPAARDGTTPNIVLTFENPITQIVDPSRLRIVNVTQLGHRYYPGDVTWTVTPISNGGSLISVVGTGSGNHSFENRQVGGLFFGGMMDGVAKACDAMSGGYQP